MEAAIALNNIYFSYTQNKILKNFDLEIQSGKIYCLIGESGSGKSTCLRIMNGLLEPQQGTVNIEGQPFEFKNSEQQRRKMGYAIQGSGLFPHLNVLENLSIIAKREKWTEKKIKQRAIELCESVNLPTDTTFFKKKIRELSGGQQQRVGIARSLFMSPKILLMDEPFGALDPITREEIQKEFLQLQEKLKLTIVVVTHDLSEAFLMADEIVLLNKGEIAQHSRPSDFLLKPKSEYVRKFVQSHSPGKMLENIKLYSVINSDVYTAQKNGDSILLENSDLEFKKQFNNLSEIKNFLTQKNQSSIYWIDKDNKFQKYENLDTNVQRTTFLSSKDHLLKAMKKVIESSQDTIPVTNRHSQLIGVFSKEALDAL